MHKQNEIIITIVCWCSENGKKVTTSKSPDSIDETGTRSIMRSGKDGKDKMEDGELSKKTKLTSCYESSCGMKMSILNESTKYTNVNMAKKVDL